MDFRNLTYSYYIKNKRRKILPEGFKDASVLDLGAGSSNYSAFFHQDKYIAVDLDCHISNGEFRFIQADISS